MVVTMKGPLRLWLPLPLPVSASWQGAWTCLRGMKMSISDIRKGDTVKQDGKYFVVQSIASACSGRGARTYNMTLKDLLSSSVIASKPASGDMLDKVEFVEKQYQFLYHDGETLFLQDRTTFEPFELARKAFLDGDALPYLEAGHMVRIKFHDETAVYGMAPSKVLMCTVQEVLLDETPPSSDACVGVIASGRKVVLPGSCKLGDQVAIDTVTGKVTR